MNTSNKLTALKQNKSDSAYQVFWFRNDGDMQAPNWVLRPRYNLYSPAPAGQILRFWCVAGGSDVISYWRPLGKLPKRKMVFTLHYGPAHVSSAV